MPVGRAALCVEMKTSEQNVTEPQRAIQYVFCINMQDLKKKKFTKTDSVSVMQKALMESWNTVIKMTFTVSC